MRIGRLPRLHFLLRLGFVPRLGFVLLVCAVVAACAGAPNNPGPAPGPPVGEATSSSGTGAQGDPQPPGATSTTRPSATRWRVGAKPLPLRPDGFGKVLPTPAALRDRRLPTVDRLPPPPGGRFRSAVRPIGAAVRARMGATWKPGCPVGLADLRYLTVSFRGFDGKAHTGELVVHERVAGQVVSVFARLYRARFPIEEMRLVTGADLEAHPTGDGNNTAAFVCRAARKQARWSAHAYGLAVDVNPFQNPYRRGDLVLPELAGSYENRARARPGMIRPGDAVTRAFADIGWTWGGTWRSPKDLMHFSATGG
ncbi:MAG TPA: M15 family metallopeptidase [Actinomycetota bacterium]|nr:M15 family metallopeptidase [Actinomycetota bacterium]